MNQVAWVSTLFHGKVEKTVSFLIPSEVISNFVCEGTSHRKKARQQNWPKHFIDLNLKNIGKLWPRKTEKCFLWPTFVPGIGCLVQSVNR